MANAKKCDRCGAYYTESEYSMTIRIVGGCHLSAVFDNNGVDLCTRCVSDFADFVEEFKDVED